jgi:hypothetical protein
VHSLACLRLDRSVMRFHFHVRYADHFVEDFEGVELAGLDAVRDEAADSARDLIAERIKYRVPVDMDAAFEVRDEGVALVHRLPFAAVLLDLLSPSPTIVPSDPAWRRGAGD